jgi:hypothetical protein
LGAVAIQGATLRSDVAEKQTKWVNQRWIGGVSVNERLLEGTFCTSNCARIEFCSCALGDTGDVGIVESRKMFDFLLTGGVDTLHTGKGYLQYLDLWTVDNCPTPAEMTDPSKGLPCPEMKLLLFNKPEAQSPDPAYRQTVDQFFVKTAADTVAGVKAFGLSHFSVAQLERKLETHLLLMSPDQVKRAEHVVTRLKRDKAQASHAHEHIHHAVCSKDGIFNANHTCSGPHAHDLCPADHFCMATGHVKGCCKPCSDCRQHGDSYPGTSCGGPVGTDGNHSWSGQKWCHDITSSCPDACLDERFDHHSELRL